jgi:hypothetical protein
MPSLDLWKQLIDDAIIKEGVFVNNTEDFWSWLQVVYYHEPRLNFSEKLANEILDNLKGLVKAYKAYKDRMHGR